jgi:phosphate transport system permease protein
VVTALTSKPNTRINSLSGASGRRVDRLVVLAMRFSTYSLVTVVLLIIVDILVKGLPHVSLEFLTASPRLAGSAGGILPAIAGTASLVAVALAVAQPLSLATAIYLSEYAGRSNLTRLIRMAILTLSGVPSIVFGLFGLALFVIHLGFGTSILSGGLTLALMITPTMTVAAEEAIESVPNSLREASRSLGATNVRTIWSVVLPSALPGILTGTLLGLGRAAGETAPILLTAAAFFLPVLPGSIFDEVMALPYHLYVLSTQHPDAASIAPMQYATACVLLMIVFAFSIAAFVLRNQLRR